MKRKQQGFNLIELTLVIIIVGVGLVGIVTIQNNSVLSLNINESVQQVAQYAQECAERVLSTRRSSTFVWASGTGINSTMCNTTADTPAGQLPALPSGFSRTVSVTTVSGNGTTCPTGTNNCKNVQITVTNGTRSSTIDLMLAEY